MLKNSKNVQEFTDQVSFWTMWTIISTNTLAEADNMEKLKKDLDIPIQIFLFQIFHFYGSCCAAIVTFKMYILLCSICGWAFNEYSQEVQEDQKAL